MGVRTRGVLCLTNHISSLPLEGCGHERPADSQVCNQGPCESRIDWFTGPWSQVGGEGVCVCMCVCVCVYSIQDVCVSVWDSYGLGLFDFTVICYRGCLTASMISQA